MFSNRLRSTRKGKKLSQEELAKLIKTTKSTISNYENGYSTPSNEVLIKIADVLNTSTDYLLGRIDDPDPDAPFQKALAAIPDLTKPHDKEYAMKRVRDLIETVIPGLAGKEVPEAHVNIIMANIEAVIEELKKEGKQEK